MSCTTAAPTIDNFVLKVQGDSMATEAILDGDFLIISRGATPSPGDMVIAEEAGHVKAKRYTSEDTTKVQGVVVGMMRKF